MLGIFGGVTVLELVAVALPLLWRVRKVLVGFIIAGLPAASGGLFVLRPTVASGLLLLTSAYRVFNMLRIIDARIDERYLRLVVRRTSLWLIGWQVVIGVAWSANRQVAIGNRVWFWMLVGVQLVVASILAISTRRSLRKTAPLAPAKAAADRDLPSITVAIPARNEDEQLEACLRSILANDYPKLEVLVYDDCSMDKTAEVIRSFAHDGVRFVQGKEPNSSWLAKNKAYDQLAKAASGEIILFCGVDVRFEAGSIRQLIMLLTSKHKTMLSVLPIGARRGLSLVQSMRYYWELALPRRQFNRPPVLSSCWLITTQQLKKSGGFEAVRHSITPEAHFARDAVQHDGYSFMRSSEHLGITSVKPLNEQRSTAERTRYPALHRRPELVFAVSLVELVLLFAPFILVLVGLTGMFGWPAEIILALVCVLLAGAYHAMALATFTSGRAYALGVFPLAVAVDIAMLHYSMWKYEFSEVEWRGRNVCIPVMRTYPHLPKA